MEEYEKFLSGLRAIRSRINNREREIAAMSDVNRDDCALFWNTVKRAKDILGESAMEDLELELGIQGWERDHD